MNAITEQQSLAHWPLSPEQRAVLVAAETSESDTQHAASAQSNDMVADIQGALDSSRLERALSDLRQQLEVLATALKSVEGYRVLRLQALEELPAIEWRYEDLRGSDDKANGVRDYSEALKLRPMAVESGELLRPALLRTGETTWMLVLTVWRWWRIKAVCSRWLRVGGCAIRVRRR